MKRIFSWQAMLLIFMAFFFIRNLMLPMASDDIPYAFIWDGADLEPRPEGSHNLMYAQYYGWKRVITDGEDRREADDSIIGYLFGC